MEMDLKGKIALVTGAGRGIGRAIALALAREGVDIFINDIDSADAEEAAKEIGALGRKSMAVLANVVDEAQVREMMDRVVRQWGGIDILVNNAGISSLILVEDMDKAEWDRVVDVNLGGTFNCSRFAIPIMKKRGGRNDYQYRLFCGKADEYAFRGQLLGVQSGRFGIDPPLGLRSGPL